MPTLQDFLSSPIPAEVSVPFFSLLTRAQEKHASSPQEEYVAARMPELLAAHAAAVHRAQNGELEAPPGDMPHVRGWDAQGIHLHDRFSLPEKTAGLRSFLGEQAENVRVGALLRFFPELEVADAALAGKANLRNIPAFLAGAAVPPVAIAGGAYMLGRRHGGAAQPAASAPELPLASKVAAARYLLKHADYSAGGAPEAAMPTQSAGPQIMPTNYLQAELMGQQAQDQQAVNFYKDKSLQSQQSAQAAQEQVGQIQEQLAGLQQQAAQTQQMIEQSQQQVMQANDEALRRAQEAANTRIGMQQMRAQLMDLASQDPAAAAAQSMQGGGQPPADPNAQPGDVPTAPGQDGAAPQQAGPEPGGPPGGPGTMGPPPGATPAGAQAVEPTTQAKLSSAAGFLRGAGQKAKDIGKTIVNRGGDLVQPTIDWVKHNKVDAAGMAAGAVAGGIFGGTSTAGEAAKYREKARQIEATQAEGKGTFGLAIEKYYATVRGAQAQLTADHPVAGILSGAAGGAALGKGAVGLGKGVVGGAKQTKALFDKQWDVHDAVQNAQKLAK